MPTPSRAQRGARPPRAARNVVAAGLCAAALVLAGCSDDPEQPVPTPTIEVTPAATANKVAPPEPALPLTWPLTGVEATDVATRPAVAVKIENSKDARPQTGLEQADVVWEEMVEGGITRYIAVYHSQVPEEVGPIRSVRPMDSNIIAPLGGLLVFSGGQPIFVSSVSEVGLQVVSHDAGASGFYRTSSRVAPHNVFGTPSTFLAQADAEHSAAPAPEFVFARDEAQASAAASGAPTNAISITMSAYSHPSWTWDAASGTFQRAEAGTAAVSSTGARFSAKNVVVMNVAMYDTGTVDPAGSPVPESEVIGSGTALVASGGRSVEATWSKTDASSPFVLTAADGSPVTLAPGQTWVELVPNTTGSFSTS
ncbi:DUF3048 domain-containing protein [Sanguibacter antarcticus]|uniref:DUF3048 family protein n=1 Tax=Sanguibacter antarcticus TaxID=372484 RepID=A0A2A9E6E3_9MICO|nr:DUF3048 domain-containing protein [Sanguibacter antarcticus]PFG34131.1 Protein of unknown function (DUF3048) [Sanguibacter antarcticus]